MLTKIHSKSRQIQSIQVEYMYILIDYVVQLMAFHFNRIVLHSELLYGTFIYGLFLCVH